MKKITPKEQNTETTRKLSVAQQVEKKLLERYGNDPLYVAVIKADSAHAQEKALDTLTQLRGESVVNDFMSYGQRQWALLSGNKPYNEG